MHRSFPVLVALTLVSCAAHAPPAQVYRLRGSLANAQLIPTRPQTGELCLLSTAKCADLARQPPALCFAADGRCPSQGQIIPLAALAGR